jgi:hypothetical protein
MEDKLIMPHVSHIFASIFTWALAALTLVYGIYRIKKTNAVKSVKVGAKN